MRKQTQYKTPHDLGTSSAGFCKCHKATVWMDHNLDSADRFRIRPLFVLCQPSTGDSVKTRSVSPIRPTSQQRVLVLKFWVSVRAPSRKRQTSYGQRKVKWWSCFFGLFSLVWDRLGPKKGFWGRLGAFWSVSGHFGPFWPVFAHYGPFLAAAGGGVRGRSVGGSWASVGVRGRGPWAVRGRPWAVRGRPWASVGGCPDRENWTTPFFAAQMAPKPPKSLQNRRIHHENAENAPKTEKDPSPDESPPKSP